MAREASIARAKKKPKFAVRQKSRCELCGRAQGYMRTFKMCRICFRTLSLRGMVPGVTKSSW